ncbi:MAG TPA: bifunctional phosphoribosylaminoimidazolecarboxamide formyltransferase/IMP cyclohydrolase [Polyangiaceae bacterium]|jgi:phosphoribosylaminoimidazolecarboxamide formyltransferase/IMP cyclohydrolase
MTVRRALLSVSDKSGLVAFARGLAQRGVDLLSTGGTLAALEAEGVPARSVESYTESPEVMGGRVKTLHPRIHGGILGREGTDDQDLLRLGAAWIDLVVVNLYPFESVLARGDASFAELVENIDIGGPSMLRSAAKNHARVGVISDPEDYAHVLAELDEAGRLSDELRERLAAKAFAHTAAYDAAISGWLSKARESDGWPRYLTLPFEKAYSLRYGENPHQRGAFYRERGAPAGSLARSESLNPEARELSFNNLVDVDAALEAVREFETPAAVVIKHATVCGAASAKTLAAAYRAAREADALSAFGGIVALNRPVDTPTAALLAETFLECIVAPSFSELALAALRAKKGLRLLATKAWLDANHGELMLKRVGGGLLAQSRDASVGGEVENARVTTEKQPSAAELEALEFAWRVCKHVRSNAIVLARTGPEGFQTVGIGGGQTSRVDAVVLAAQKAGERARGSVLASDAFFPFPDGIERAAAAGVVAVAQPGGSKKDADVIAAADSLGLAMVFTGARHFRH